MFAVRGRWASVGVTREQAAVKGDRRSAERTLDGCVPHIHEFHTGVSRLPAVGLDARKFDPNRWCASEKYVPYGEVAMAANGEDRLPFGPPA